MRSVTGRKITPLVEKNTGLPLPRVASPLGRTQIGEGRGTVLVACTPKSRTGPKNPRALRRSSGPGSVALALTSSCGLSPPGRKQKSRPTIPAWERSIGSGSVALALGYVIDNAGCLTLAAIQRKFDQDRVWSHSLLAVPSAFRTDCLSIDYLEHNRFFRIMQVAFPSFSTLVKLLRLVSRF